MPTIPFGPGAFRLVLALLVVGAHLSSFGIGRPAVFVFFMLSGYWVMRAFAADHRRPGAVRRFYLSRALRVWPAFAAAFLAVFALYQVLPPRGAEVGPGFLAGLALLGIATTRADVLGVSWSLDVELQFYLLVPILFVAVQRVPPALLALATLLLTALGWMLQTRLGLMTALSYLPAFAAGLWLFERRPLVSGRAALASLAAFAAIGSIVWASPGLHPLLDRHKDMPFPEDWFGLAWTLTLLPLVAWNVCQPSGALDRHLGRLSYTVYLVHWPVILTAHTLLPSVEGWMLLLVGLAIAAVVLPLYVLVELPLERRRPAIVGRLMGEAGVSGPIGGRHREVCQAL